jgi:poly(A) polymerase
MLRAVRFAAKLGFRLHPDTEKPLHRLGHLLRDVPPARLFDEILKLLLGGYAVQTYELLRHYRLFGHLFPATECCLSHQQQHFPKTLLFRALANTDARLAENKPVTPAFLYAALLWEPLRERVRKHMATGARAGEAHTLAADDVIRGQLDHTALPRRYSLPMREIWALQSRFESRAGKAPLRLLSHPRFRAAYDFLLLRAESGEEMGDLPQWWTEFQTFDETAQVEATKEKAPRARKRRRPRRRPAGLGIDSASQP